MRRDNHYVPMLYLKQWAREGKIPTYRLLVAHEKCPFWKDQSIKAVAFHQHLYTYFSRDGETDEFERWLDREFENPAEEAISRVISEQQLTPEHWRRLARFAFAQDVRTPARFQEFLARQDGSLQTLMNETVEEAVKELTEAEERGVRLPKPPAHTIDPFPLKVSITKQEDGSGTIGTRTVVGRKLWLGSVRHLLTDTIEKLPAYRWTILHAPPGISWPTSDNPVVRLNYYGPNNYDFKGGWGVENMEILLPLGPKHLLFTSVGKKPWRRGTILDLETARRMRNILIEHADRYVFAREPGDVHRIRPRLVCAETYKAEQATWRNWHREQSEAEAELL
jgi:hypothetical protein